MQGSSNSFTKFNFSIQGCTGNITTDANDYNDFKLIVKTCIYFIKQRWMVKLLIQEAPPQPRKMVSG